MGRVLRADRAVLSEGRQWPPPVGLERMLRMYFIANWFNLADEACEDALYDVPVFRQFCHIDLGRERVPDATTLLNFRHLLEAHQLGAAMFAKVGELLLKSGMKLSGGTIVDAIAELKSLTWPTQNPAVDGFTAAKANKFPLDSLFVIGRNIHQEAVGSANSAKAYIKDFMAKTKDIDPDKRKALLDGMLRLARLGSHSALFG